MKTLKNVLVIISLTMVFGCKSGGPYEMFTRINSDGSCYREFVRNVDSAYVVGDTSKNPFPVDIDSSWNLAIHKRIEGDTSIFNKYPAHVKYKHPHDSAYAYFAVARKQYSSVGDMAKLFKFNSSKNWDAIVPEIRFNKVFRWFYTYYHFNETYPEINIFHLVPIEDYLSDEEVNALYGENSTLFKGKNGLEIKDMLDELEKRADEWLNHNLYEENFNIFLRNITRFKDIPVDSATFAVNRDSVYIAFKDSLEVSNFEIVDVFDRYYHTDAFSKNEFDKLVEAELGDRLSNFIIKFEVALNYRLSMPDKIIETNAPFISGDTLTWRLDANRFLFNDYTISAVSRKPNYWAFLITGFVVILSGLGLLIKRKIMN